MVTVAVSRAAYEDCGENERPVQADGADGVVENAVVGPLRQGFFFGFAEAEVDLGAEELVDAHVAVCGEQFLGADEAERVVEVGGHEVLAAFTASQGKHRDTCPLAARFVGEHAAVFIVRMGDDEHERGAGAKLYQQLLQRGRAVVDLKGIGEALWRDLLACKIGRVWHRLLCVQGGCKGGGCQEKREGSGAEGHSG